MSEEYRVSWCPECQANTYHEDGFCMECPMKKIYGEVYCDHCLQPIEFHDEDSFICEKCGRVTCYECGSLKDDNICGECAGER